ncbi:MAG: VTT domain-containing protein [Planctomycetales bacterium]|nr:VTT domain-containing protein [Planctomycetales bacterium]
MNNQLLKPLLLVAVVLVLPLVAIAVWGESFRSVAERWQESPPARPTMALAIVAILASDVFLPVPSGPISTLAGSQLGFALGTAASTLGMTLGAGLAFGLARLWGRPLAERFSSTEQLVELEDACLQHGPWMLLLTRPLPILAEACALLVGALQMPWKSFLPTVVVSNSLIAATYSALGQQAVQRGWLPMAICASVAVPVALSWWWRKRLQQAG